MNGRFGAVLRAVGALACSLALIVGVPLVLLATVGNPFPSSLPSFGEIETVLTQNGQGFSEFLLSVLALIVWFVWAQLIVAFAFELVFAARGRETPRLPTAPGIQSIAARLVTAMTLAATLAVAPLLSPAAGALQFDGPLSASHTVASPAVAGPSLAGLVPTSPVVEPAVAAPQALAAASDLLELPESVEPRVTVSLGVDTELWDLSEAAYGDGVQWKLIAAANAGVHDASGSVITTETEVVSAGTHLDLPGQPDAAGLTSFGARLATADQVAEFPATDATQLIQPGDSMWSLAEAEVADRLGRAPSEAEVAEYWAEVVQANTDTPSGDPDLIYPGDMLAMPGRAVSAAPAGVAEPAIAASDGGLESAERDSAEPDIDETAIDATGPAVSESPVSESPVPESAESPVSESPVSESPVSEPAVSAPEPVDGSEAHGRVVAPAVTSPVEDSVSTTGSAASDAERGLPARQLAIAAFGSALFAAGFVAAIKRRRDLQRRLRAPGSPLPTASTEAAQLELALRHRSSQVIESAQGGNWRLLPAQAVVDLRAPSARELRVDPDGGTSIVDAPEATGPGEDAVAPAPVKTTTQHDVDAEQIDIVEVAPSALIVGTDPATGEAVLLDLERASTISLIGSPAEVRRFAQSAVLDLAVSDRAADLCVVAVGIAEGLEDLERVQCVDSMAAALVAAVHCGHASTASGGSSDATLGLTTPLVVVATAEPIDDADAVEALVELGAVVLGPGIEADVRITLNADRAHIWPTGTTALVAALSVDDFDAAAELVEVTSVAEAQRAPTDTSDAPPTPDPDGDSIVDAVVDDDAAETAERCGYLPPEPGPLEVQILGPVEVVGAKAFSSVKAVDVIAYLSFHRNGVDADQIKTWVWPGFDPPTNKAFANVMSRARAGLGVDADGDPYLSKAGADKTYRLAASVTTDFERFESLVGLADGTDDQEFELEYLRQALDLIRGVPFTGGSVTSFAWADNHVRAHVEFSIDEAVHRCADLALSRDDLATARWAALKGLELVPGCEQCFRRRFLVAGAGSNRTELRRAMADLERITAAELGEPEAVDLISEDLLSLYHGLDRELVAASAHEART